jgi:hypothetical protein
MKVTHILCAILACASLSFEARATASSEDGRPSRPEANAGQASGRTAPGQDASAKPEGTHDREPAPARARTGSGSPGGGSTGSGSTGGRSPGGVSKARDAAAAASPRRGSVTPPRSGAQGGPARAARGNADRLNSMLNARAHGRLARQPSRPAGTARAVARGPEVRGPRDAGPAGQPKLGKSNTAAPPTAMVAGQPKLATSNSPASPASRPAPTPRNSAIGGPHAQTLGRVGGPAISRTTHGATIDGNQLHHKF